VAVPFHVDADVLEPAAALPSAVAFTDPAATAAAKLARFATNADLTAMASPAETDDAVIDTFVWLAMLSMPVNNAFQLDASTVSPADTVEIAV